MASLSNVAQTAVKRQMYIYGFYRLCKVHNVRHGAPEDLLQLRAVLDGNAGFRSGVSRLAESVFANEPGVLVNEVAAMVALAIGGSGIATQDEVEVPDELIRMLRSVLRPDQHPNEQAPSLPIATQEEPGSASEDVHSALVAEMPGGPADRNHRTAPGTVGVPAPQAAAPAEATGVPPAAAGTVPIAIWSRQESGGPRDQTHPQPAEPPPFEPRRRPILQQALLADEPDELGPTPVSAVSAMAPALEVVGKVERLETERIALERRMSEMEDRLNHVVHEVEALSAPARVPAQPGPQLVEPPRKTSEALERRDPDATAQPDTRVRGQAGRIGGRVDGRKQPAPLLVPLRVPGPEPPAFRHAESDERADREPEAYFRSPRTGEGVAEPARWTRWVVAICALLLVFAAGVLGRRFLLPHAAAAPTVQAVPGVSEGAGPSRQSAGTPAPGQHAPARVPDQDRLANRTRGPAAAGDPDGQIRGTLYAWAAVAGHNDPAAESSFYAPRLDRYFLQRNVSRDYVIREKRAYQDRGNRIQRFTISGLGIQRLTPSSAMVSLTKTWSAVGPRQAGGVHSTRSRLWMKRMPDGWKITGEQDLEPAR